jgi:pimeloyl-ACP methyl ester carboxylesterase
VQTENYNPSGAKTYTPWADWKPDNIQHPTEQYHGAQLYVEYGCGNDEIRKPFIFVEGFSPREFGPNRTYINWYNRHQAYQVFNENSFQILDELSANGYDVIYVDFRQGTGDITKNAETFEEVLKWVNAQKDANGSSHPNVVLGYSMGGLIARLGIRYMEMDGEDPDVSYYITRDTPHLGANVPLAMA